MKKLIFLISLVFILSSAEAQKGFSLTFTPASNDSIVGAVTKYCTLSSPITGQYTGAIEVFITESISGTDSVWVSVEGSMNNSTWYTLNMGTPVIGGTAAIRSGVNHIAMTNGNGWVMWQPTWYIQPPYLRIKVQKYVATSSIKITRAKIYLKR